MKTLAVTACLSALLAVAAARGKQEPPKTPPPVKEHEWLKQLVGEWETEGEITMDPSKLPLKNKGTESGKMIGGFWAMLETKAEFMGTPFNGVLTLGYDPEKKKYVGTWVDSTSGHLWTYTGSVDAAGKMLTLDSEGPSHDGPGKTAKYRETIEIKDKDHKVFTSSIEKDGKWVTPLTVKCQRKK
jgi:hypothetical protein